MAEPIFQDLYLVPSYEKTHGILMGLAFVVFFPTGAFLIRGLNFKGAVWVHVACQLIGWLFMIGGLATGVRMAQITDLVLYPPLQLGYY
jgi:hypothetical protein